MYEIDLYWIYEENSLELSRVLSMLLFLITYPLLQTWAALVFSESQPSLLSRDTPVSSLVAQTVKNLSAKQETWFDPWVRKTPWRREWLPTPVFLPGEFHGQGSLVGYSPQSRKESDTTEQLTLSLFFPHSVVWKWDKGSVEAVLIHLVCFSSPWAHCSSFSHVRCLENFLIYILSSLKWQGKPGHCCSRKVW